MTPTPSHARLWALEGTWTGTRGDVHATLVYRRAIGGLFVVSDYVETEDGRAVFEGHGVYGYDVARGVYTMYWFDPGVGGGPSAPIPGSWLDDTLAFERESPRVRYVYRFDGPDRVTFTIEVPQDGGAMGPVFEVRLGRVRASPSP